MQVNCVCTVQFGRLGLVKTFDQFKVRLLSLWVISHCVNSTVHHQLAYAVDFLSPRPHMERITM